MHTRLTIPLDSIMLDPFKGLSLDFIDAPIEINTLLPCVNNTIIIVCFILMEMPDNTAIG